MKVSIMTADQIRKAANIFSLCSY